MLYSYGTTLYRLFSFLEIQTICNESFLYISENNFLIFELNPYYRNGTLEDRSIKIFIFIFLRKMSILQH